MKLTDSRKLAAIMIGVVAFFLIKGGWEAFRRAESSKEAPVQDVVEESRIPTFADYPTDESATGTPAKVDFTGNSPALQFRTVITQAAAEGPNFAGRYTVVTWGCGSACQQTAIVDAETGRIVAYNLLTASGVKYRLDSRLLIAFQPSQSAEPGPDIAHYYVMRGGDLRLNGLVEPGTGEFVPFQAD